MSSMDLVLEASSIIVYDDFSNFCTNLLGYSAEQATTTIIAVFTTDTIITTRPVNDQITTFVLTTAADTLTVSDTVLVTPTASDNMIVTILDTTTNTEYRATDEARVRRHVPRSQDLQLYVTTPPLLQTFACNILSSACSKHVVKPSPLATVTATSLATVVEVSYLNLPFATLSDTIVISATQTTIIDHYSGTLASLTADVSHTTTETTTLDITLDVTPATILGGGTTNAPITVDNTVTELSRTTAISADAYTVISTDEYTIISTDEFTVTSVSTYDNIVLAVSTDEYTVTALSTNDHTVLAIFTDDQTFTAISTDDQTITAISTDDHTFTATSVVTSVSTDDYTVTAISFVPAVSSQCTQGSTYSATDESTSFLESCNTNFVGYEAQSSTGLTYETCMDQCAQSNDNAYGSCVGISYDRVSLICSLKYGIPVGQESPDMTVDSARITGKPACINGVTLWGDIFLPSSGDSYIIFCAINDPQYDTNPPCTSAATSTDTCAQACTDANDAGGINAGAGDVPCKGAAYVPHYPANGNCCLKTSIPPSNYGTWSGAAVDTAQLNSQG